MDDQPACSRWWAMTAEQAANILTFSLGRTCRGYHSASPLARWNTKSFPFKLIIPSFRWNFHLFLFLFIWGQKIRIQNGMRQTHAEAHHIFLCINSAAVTGGTERTYCAGTDLCSLISATIATILGDISFSVLPQTLKCSWGSDRIGHFSNWCGTCNVAKVAHDYCNRTNIVWYILAASM